MLNLPTDWFRGRVRIGLDDVADILIASVLVYCVVRLAQITRHRAPLTGGAVLLLLYFAARLFGLFLTEMLLRGAAFVLVVVFAIAFHEDIRRTVAQFRGARWRSSHRNQRPIDELDPVIRFAFECAAEKIGALIVHRGRDSLDGLLQSGIELTAPVHPVLLKSIFDPHTPGHDGAIVIDEGRVQQMCVHLPLSSDQRELGNLGTRHSAGLGLSQRSDALVIIVSEERGAVSVATRGKLIPMATPVELKETLENFTERNSPASSAGRHPRRLFQRFGWKAASLAIAIVGWLLFASHPDKVERTFVVPVEYRNVPERLRVDAAPTEARLTLAGPEPAFTLLAPSALRISVSIESREAGPVEIHVTEKDCIHPSSLDVYDVEPRVLRFRLVEREPIPAS